MVSGVDLSGQTHWFPEEEKDSYLNYGVAASQVRRSSIFGNPIAQYNSKINRHVLFGFTLLFRSSSMFSQEP